MVKKVAFKIKKLNMRFRMVQAQESFVNQAKAIGLGTTSPALIPFTQNKDSLIPMCKRN